MSYETMTEADKTIARVWRALGISAYAESGGIEISQIVAKRVAELAEARAEIARKDAELKHRNDEYVRLHDLLCEAGFCRDIESDDLYLAIDEVLGLRDKAVAEGDALKVKLAEDRAEIARRQHINSQDPWLEHPQAIEQPSHVFELSEDDRRVNDLWLASEWGCERCREGTCYWRNHLGDWAADLLIASRAELARKDTRITQLLESQRVTSSRYLNLLTVWSSVGVERDAYKAKLDEAFSYLSIAYHNVPDVVTGWDSTEWLDRVQIFLAANKPATETKEK